MKNNFMYCFLLLSWTTIHSILIHFLNTHFLNLFDTFVVGVRHLLEAANNSILWSILPFLHIYSQTGSVLPRLLILSRKRYFLAFDVFDITLCIVRILTKVCKIFLKELKVKKPLPFPTTPLWICIKNEYKFVEWKTDKWVNASWLIFYSE